MVEEKPHAFEDPRANRPTGAASTEPELRERHDPYAAFRYRGYRLFSIGNVASVIGRQMLNVAVGWEVYQRTKSATALGLIGLVQALPIILLAIPAGHVADRFSRRGILLVTQAIAAASSVGLAALSIAHADVKWIFALLFAAGIARSFSWAARGAFMVNLVKPADFGNAVTWNSSIFELSSVTGPAIGGLLIAKLGFPLVYGIDAACALVFLGCLLLISAPVQAAHSEAAGLRGLFAGMRFVWDTKIILATVTLDLFAVLFGGASAILPIFADKILHCGAIGLGWLRAAPSMGAFAMTLLLTHLPPMRRAGTTMLWAVGGFGLTMIGFALSRSFALSMFLLFLSGACDNVSVIVRHTLVQLLTPDAMRGRVSAVNNVFIGSSNELGAFESGVAAAWLGAARSVMLGGVATVLIVLAVAKKWPQVRALGAFSSVKPAGAAG